MNLAYLLLLSFAVSIDSFGVGITYGFRKVVIPISSILIISLASAIMIIFSMQLGVWISLLLSPLIAKWVGSIILIIIGIWVIVQVLFQKHKGEDIHFLEQKKNRDNIISIEIRRLGLVIQILRTPMKADMDRSGIISSFEAIVLGIALSLDAFGAGLGAALLGFQPLITAVTIASMSGLFILLGLKLGFVLSGVRWLRKITILPGIIMVIIGLIKII